ncbi:MAG: type II toxin-antitoxin system PemK/MazF family toxin [Psychrosphaera sp.]|nr:type II toxin-antitoxin system PemK/MazF family toxin [Psychrosphaera sp.]
MIIQVEFIHFSIGACLGSVKYSDIIEILIPAFKYDAHDIFITKHFASQPEITSWQVHYIFTDNEYVFIFLKEHRQPLSLTEYSARQYKKPNFYLRPFQIVEVAFSFHSYIYTIENDTCKNLSDTTALLPGELHKMRPCIILKSEQNRVQVLPLTSSSNNDRNTVIEINPVSFQNLATRYKRKTSFALINMTQTVSIHRIYPPRDHSGRFNHNYPRYKLVAADQNAIKIALVGRYSKEIVLLSEQLSTKVEDLNHQKAKLLNTINNLRKDLDDSWLKQAQLISERDSLLKLIKKIGLFFDLGESIEAIKKSFD